MTRRLIARLAFLALGAAVLAACEGHEFHPPDREARVAEADSIFSEELFDTLSWSSNDERIQAGNLVFADECRRCHGPLGRGDTEYARSRDLEVPSLVEPDWRFADDPEAVRRVIFTGHSEDMPTWGIAGLTPRQIDAAAYYIVDQLRQEVTDSTRLPGS